MQVSPLHCPMPLSHPRPNISHWHPKSSLYSRQGLRRLGHINYICRLRCHLTSGSTQTTASRRTEESKVTISSPVPFPPGSHYVLVMSLPQTHGSGAFLFLPNHAPSGLERLTLPYSCCFKSQCFPKASSHLY